VAGVLFAVEDVYHLGGELVEDAGVLVEGDTAGEGVAEVYWQKGYSFDIKRVG